MPRTGDREAEHEDVEQLGAGSGTEGIDANAKRVAATLNQQTLAGSSTRGLTGRRWPIS
jgi:hypothetical protein